MAGVRSAGGERDLAPPLVFDGRLLREFLEKNIKNDKEIFPGDSQHAVLR